MHTLSLAILFLPLVACDSATRLAAVSPLSPQDPLKITADGVGASTIQIGGQLFYADEYSGDVGPVGAVQARINNYASRVTTISCSGNNCSASYEASHTGMWHKSTQTMAWHLKNIDTGNDFGVSVARSGGDECVRFATLGPNLNLFCIDRRQANTVSAVVPMPDQPCDARAQITTDHSAAYLWTAGISIGWGAVSITPGQLGENTKTSFGTPTDWHDSSCDVPPDGGGTPYAPPVVPYLPPAGGSIVTCINYHVYDVGDASVTYVGEEWVCS